MKNHSRYLNRALESGYKTFGATDFPEMPSLTGKCDLKLQYAHILTQAKFPYTNIKYARVMGCREVVMRGTRRLGAPPKERQPVGWPEELSGPYTAACRRKPVVRCEILG